MKHIVDELLESAAYRVTRYFSPKLVARATRIGGKKKLPKTIDIRVKFCRPNYLERRVIKACVKAGTAFPLKHDYLKMPSGKK